MSNIYIEVIGIGLESSLPKHAIDLVLSADCLVGSNRLLNYFPDFDREIIVLGDLMGAIAKIKSLLETNDVKQPVNAEQASDLTEADANSSARSTKSTQSTKSAKSAKSIVILTSGDPLFFGLGRLLLEHLPPETLRFHPHVSSVQLAFNRLKIPWQDAQIVSAHGRSLDALEKSLRSGAKNIAVLTDAVNNPVAIANFIQALRLPCHYRLWVCENLGSIEESVFELPDWDQSQSDSRISDIAEPKFAALNVVILQREMQREPSPQLLSNLPLLGIPDDQFHSFPDRPGLITKREVRIISIGELALQPGQVVWDIGAGTGAVAIEMARLIGDGQVFAIEKTAVGVTLIEKNCQRFGTTNVQVVKGTAPEALANLPAPDRIFIGGSSGKLTEILTVCGDRLKSGGVLVANFASPEHLAAAMSWLRSRHYAVQLLQVNLARSVPIGDVSRFAPLNPVTILQAVF